MESMESQTADMIQSIENTAVVHYNPPNINCENRAPNKSKYTPQADQFNAYGNKEEIRHIHMPMTTPGGEELTHECNKDSKQRSHRPSAIAFETASTLV